MVVVELVGQKKSLSGILIRGEMVGPIRAYLIIYSALFCISASFCYLVVFVSNACNMHQRSENAVPLRCCLNLTKHGTKGYDIHRKPRIADEIIEKEKGKIQY